MKFELFQELMAFDTKGGACIEILFSVEGSSKFFNSWMGKMPDKQTGRDLFWYGLTADGENAYDYPNFKEFSSDKVFDGKSLLEIWDSITFIEINGCEPNEMIETYLYGNDRLGAPLEPCDDL